jgi:hypothetical protein
VGGFFRMRAFFILRSVQRARLEGREAVMQPFVSILA